MMTFQIMLYGSFPDTNGYSWWYLEKQKSSKLPKEINMLYPDLERIQQVISGEYADGRRMADSTIYGGYFIDVDRNLFYAFRSASGGIDALGRSGTVRTVWAITRYSNVFGKNLKPLFQKLAIMDCPVSGELELSLFDAVVEFVDLLFCKNDTLLQGEKMNSVYGIPNQRSLKNVMVKFKDGPKIKEADVKFIPGTESVVDHRKKIKQENPSNGEENFGKIKDCVLAMGKKIKLTLVVLSSCSVLIILIFCIFFNGSGSTNLHGTDPTMNDPQCDKIIIKCQQNVNWILKEKTNFWDKITRILRKRNASKELSSKETSIFEIKAEKDSLSIILKTDVILEPQSDNHWIIKKNSSILGVVKKDDNRSMEIIYFHDDSVCNQEYDASGIATLILDKNSLLFKADNDSFSIDPNNKSSDVSNMSADDSNLSND